MAANLLARNIQVFIGTDEQDWSDSCGAFLPAWDAIDEGGLITVSATLEILPLGTNPESIDPLVNPARWRPGTPVRVEVRNDAGTFVQHPQGHLFLLEEPEFPEPDAPITLQLGCRLAWHNSFEFDEDATGVVVGTPTDSATVATNLLVRNEILEADIDLTSPWPYPVTVPEGKGPGGSFVAQAGELAYCNDYRYLYVNTSGDVVNGQLNLGIETPTITITLGQNDVRYQAVKVESTPPDLVRCAGTGTVATGTEQPIVETIEVEGDRTQFEVAPISCPGSGVIGRTTNLITWNIPEAPAAITYTNEAILEAPRSSVAVDPRGTVSLTSPCDMIAWKKTKTIKRFNQDPTLPYGRLIDSVTTDTQRRFTFTTKATPGLTFSLVRRTTETPTYGDDGESIAKIVVVEEQAKGILDKESDDPLTVIEIRTDETRWTQRGNQTWTKTEVTKFPKALRNANPESSPYSVATSANTSTTSTGQNQPPRAEMWDAAQITEDQEFSGEAPYTLPGGGSGRERKRLYQLPFAFSDEQCEGMALIHVGLISGQHRACALEFPITTALLTAPPLFPFDVVFPDGSKRHYRADGLTFEHNLDQSKAVATGILVGTTAAPTEEVPDPAPVPLTAIAVVDDDVPVVDDDVPVYAVV